MKTDYIGIRLPKEMKKELKKKAEKEFRGLSSYIVTLIEKDLKGESDDN